MRDWYLHPTTETPRQTREVTWVDILSNWEAVELDLSHIHCIDMESDVLEHRSWRWLSLRILDMVHHGPRLSAALTATTITAPEGGTRGS